MRREALATLLHPFEAGVLENPGETARVLFLGAEPGFVLPDGFGGRLTLVQGFRPHFSALAKAGHDVSPTVSGEGFSAALVLCGRHRGQNELRVADALERALASADLTLEIAATILSTMPLTLEASPSSSDLMPLTNPCQIDEMASAALANGPVSSPASPESTDTI